MIYVTDTHPFVFYALGIIKKLGRNARRVFTRAERRQDTIYIPSVCFFELTLLIEGGQVRSPVPFSEWKERMAETGAFLVEPLTWEDIVEAYGLLALVDPFDHLIVGTAKRLHCPLITCDSQITDSRLVVTVW
ncbi:MAG: type II toxin-antitoxin system VapC family toxin [Deltaproteobacteria bacterium]|nr:type II toxin-antitoxin system VapC family toxin [Deltaproteobacteria bacterium]